MLFILSGDIQIGKTRWLLELDRELSYCNVTSFGVIAPGVWVTSDSKNADANGLEKIGIDNLLLPQHEVISFAKRIDLALEEGTVSQDNESARAGLGWYIDERATDFVNKHLADPPKNTATPGLVIIDELGQLELLHCQGLTQALALLDAGSTESFPHALIVVRDTLLDVALKRFEDLWGETKVISPDVSSKELIFEQFLGR